MNAKSKKIIFIISAFIIVLGLIEISSFVFFSVFKDRFNFFDINKYLINDNIIKYAYHQYHPELGWDNSYDTPFGERPRSISYDDPFISTFGDSYTYGAEVDDHETWQEYLSLLLKKDVYNFGLGAYGTDQAYLKFLSKYSEVKTPIVILALITENVNRSVNVYRPFYSQNTGIRLTKPRFIIENDKLVLLKNPIDDEKKIHKLRSPEFIEELGQNDFWYKQKKNKFPVFQFPYSKILLNKHIWIKLIYKKLLGYEISDINPRPWKDLWTNEESEAKEIMFKIFESFVEKVESEKAIPVIMIIPNIHDVNHKLKTGQNTKSMIVISNFCKANKFYCFNPIDAFCDYEKRGGKLADLYKGHTTAKGNQLIADQLFQYLKGISVLDHSLIQ